MRSDLPDSSCTVRAIEIVSLRTTSRSSIIAEMSPPLGLPTGLPGLSLEKAPIASVGGN